MYNGQVMDSGCWIRWRSAVDAVGVNTRSEGWLEKMTDLGVEVALDAHADLAEGPWWSYSDGVLLWVDVLAGDIHSFDPLTGKDRSINVGQPVGMVARRQSGGLVCAVRDGIGFVDFDSGTFDLQAPVEQDNVGHRMNDGACDPAGRLWSGTMEFDSSPGAGALYRTTADLKVTKVLENVSTSNGLDWSLDGRRFYYNDSPTKRVDVFDFDPVNGQLSNRTLFADLTGAAGVPDGLAVDSEDAVWVAMWNGACVHRFNADGELLQTIALPVSRPTSVAFGGKDLDQLFITTARTGLTESQLAEQPHAGGIFVVKPGVTGRLPYEFGG